MTSRGAEWKVDTFALHPSTPEMLHYGVYDDGALVAHIKGANGEASAKRIVQAVNSHAELVEALEKARAQMREFVDFHHKHDGGCSIEFEDATEYVEEALKKARGGK